MKKPIRITIEILLPATAFAVFTPIYHALLDFGRFSATNVPLLIGVVFVIGLLPSAAFMLVRETALAAGVTQKKRDQILSSVLGAAIGIGFLASAGDSEIWTRSPSDYLFVFGFGAVAGFCVARMTGSKKEPNQSPEPMPLTRHGSS